MNIVETIEYRGHAINIVPDEDPYNPRTENDNAGVMFCKHGHYNLGDKDAEDPFEDVDIVEVAEGVKVDDRVVEHMIDSLYTASYRAEKEGDLDAIERFRDAIHFLHYEADRDTERRMRSDIAILIPLGLYDHGGITIFHGTKALGDSAGWDSGQVGWHYMTKEAVEHEWNGDLDRARACLEAEIRTYDDYLTGAVYGYVIDEDGDSCWGFFGDKHESSGLLEYARNAIDCQIEQEEREAAEFMREEAIRKDTEGLTCD